MHIEAATPEDSRALAKVHVSSWQKAYVGVVPGEHLSSLSVSAREASWREATRIGTPRVLVARNEEGIVGFIAYGASRDQDAPTNCGEIWALYVLSTSWSTGAGRALWFAALKELRLQGVETISLWVLSENVRGRRFYSVAGFVPDLASEKEFSIGGATVKEIRLVFQIGV